MDDSQDADRWTGEPERRESPRVDVPAPGRMRVQLLSLDVPVTVVQVALGGFRLRTAFMFLVGSVHPFRFKLGDGATVDVSARVTHCLPRVTKDGVPVYLTGLEFIDSDDRQAQTAGAELLDEVSSQVSFRTG